MAEAGDHVIVLGGDYPYTLLEDGIPSTMEEIVALNVPVQVRRKIECENALNLLGSSVALPS